MINDESLRGFLSNKFKSETTCIASTALLESSGLEVPKCNEQKEQLLDNRYPTGGLFFGYTSGMKTNDFMEQLSEAGASSGAVVNIVVDYRDLSSLQFKYNQSQKLKSFIDAGKVNIIPVKADRGAIKWMQDSMQFTTMDQKVGIIQTIQEDERRRSIDKTLACQISKNCNLPIIQEAIVNFDKTVLENNPKAEGSLRAGGNLEVLPGGVILTGGSFNEDTGLVDLDPLQKEIIDSASKRTGQKVAKIDTAFLGVGHADELYNSVKISEEERVKRGLPIECNFLILEASPSKAKEILWSNMNLIDSGAGDATPVIDNNSKSSINGNRNKLNSRVYAVLDSAKNCQDLTHMNIYEGAASINIPIDAIKEKINELGCFGLSGFKANEILSNQNLKNQNWGGSDETPFSARQYLNRNAILDSVKEASGCHNPPFLEVPALIDGGHFLLPDSVNGVVINGKKVGTGSSFVAPTTFYDPFDEYLKTQLESYGVSTTQVEDLEYHISFGEVHCGSNSALVCKE